MTSTLRSVVVAIALLLVPALTFAQASKPVLPDLEAGTCVWIANSQGLELHGDLINVSPDAIEIDTAAGPRRIAVADVWTIMKKDSNKNGFLMGAGFGAVGGVMLGAVSGTVQTKDTNRGFTATMVVFGALVYGGIGAWIDNAIEGRELVYRRASDHDHPTLVVAPMADLSGANRRIGVNGAVTWR